MLWGDGAHDDTEALNAWLRGEPVLWAESRDPVGDAIADRSFRLSGPIYVRSGTQRTLERFRLVWPERPETVTGTALRAGADPDKAPIAVGVRIVGGDDGEGVPFDTPDAIGKPAPQDRSNCLIS